MRHLRRIKGTNGVRARFRGFGDSDPLDVEIRHATSEMDAGDCPGAYEAIVAAAAIGGAKGGGDADAAKVERVVSRFMRMCVRPKGTKAMAGYKLRRKARRH